MLNTFTDATVTEGGVSARTEYCFDANTGFLQRTRALASGTSRSGNDVVTRYTADFNGNVGTEESFGGDGAGLDTAASLCSLFLPGNQYQVNYTYQYGVLKTAQSAPGINFKTVDRDVDANTGLTLRSRDTAGLQITFDYDILGRPLWIKPAQDGWTQFIYTRATSPSALAEIYSAKQVNGGGTTLAESKTLFDALGRVRQEQQRMPDGTWSARAITYNAVGWKSTVSELGSTNKVTSFLNYDVFGRPGIVRPPDGAAHDITLSYSGTRSVSRTAKVATSYNTTTGTANETAATTTELYDRQGRLVQVTEPNGVATNYEYDVGGRLKRVCQGASGGICAQERLFNYDNRGFLTSEQHPEKGVSGNGTVSYLNYDSRGHARRTVDGPNDLTYSYDRAERVFQIQENGGRVLKAFTYASDNPVGNLRLGKLLQAQRYNYHELGGIIHTALITETYTYGGRQGRASQRDTQLSVDGGSNESFTQSFAWDDLGNPQTINYPQCTHAGCASPLRTVTDSYTNGWLTSISGYTGTAPGQAVGVGITYHSNGMVKDIAHANGVVVTQANDPNGMARPASITAAKGGSNLWTTGTYQYDGAGNIWKIGTSWYEYDALSRVKTGTVFPNPLGTGTQQKQTYSFDNYANLQSITTQIGANPATTRNTPTSSSTNRLTGAVSYDAAGNLTSWNGTTYEYDAFNQMRHMVTTENWLYTYTADDERVWAYNTTLNVSRWTLRDLGGKVLRELSNNGTWSVAEDYIYRDGLLLAGVLGDGQVRHFALDHLGTPRLVTNVNGTQAGYHVYYPFGEEATPFDATIDRMQFTGHERDLNAMTGANPFADDLDYMHARHYNPQLGRFLSVDPIPGNWRVPQSWNRYAYVLGAPVRFVDPYGLVQVGTYQPPPTGMTLEDYGYAEGITVFGTPFSGTSTNPLTGVAGLNGLVGGSLFMGSLSFADFSLDSYIRGIHGYYQNRFEQMAVDGHYLAAFIDWLGLQWVLPEGSKDLGVQIGLAFIPGPFDNEAYATYKAGRITGFSKHALNQAIDREGVGVSTRAILDAVRNPIKTQAAREGATKLIGREATVILNRDGKVVTTWARNSAGFRIKP